MKRVVFTDFEIKSMASLPPALEALADYHSYMETMADATDYKEAAGFHRSRYLELRAAAAFIRAAHEDDHEAEFED